MEKEFRALNQAKQEIPDKWYQSSKTRLVCSLSISAAAILLGMAEFGNPVVHITAAVMMIEGAIADHKSTIESFEASDKAREAGFNVIAGSIRETNPFLRHVKTAEDYKMINKKPLFFGIQGASIVVGTMLPGVGFGLGVGSILAVMTNHRNTNIINRATEIAQNDPS